MGPRFCGGPPKYPFQLRVRQPAGMMIPLVKVTVLTPSRLLSTTAAGVVSTCGVAGWLTMVSLPITPTLNRFTFATVVGCSVTVI